MDVFAEKSFFANQWPGGYCEGNPLDPKSKSSYDKFGVGTFDGYSVLYQTYKACIEPYINPESVVLEIGPGRGCWTKTMLQAKEIWVLEAQPAKWTGFYEYTGRPDIKYIEIQDVSCKELPLDRFNYMFSFGCFCHLSKVTVISYLENLFNKLQVGCNCFLMISDYDQYANSVGNIHSFIGKSDSAANVVRYLSGDYHENPKPVRWYNNNKSFVLRQLTRMGYTVLKEDVGTVPRDPIIYFTRKYGGRVLRRKMMS